ncbi:MAG: response regulator transcription factor [Anaerolineae bacterium]
MEREKADAGLGRILIAEDDPYMRRLLKMRLSKAGYQIFEATDGIETLQQVYKHSFDLVILDLMMPHMDGWEACRRIREFSSVPILIVSAREDRGSQVKGFDMGANAYMAKPFAMSELLKKVEALVSSGKKDA